MKKAKRPKIVVIDGIDGSGKETQTKLLQNNLEQKGLKVKSFSFPNYSDDSSILLRRYLSGEYGEDPELINPYSASSLYSVDRLNFFLKEDLTDYDIVLFDRYTTSNMIHQASKFKTEEETNEYLEWLEDFEYNKLGIPRPNLVFYLSLLPETSRKLRKMRDSTSDIHEDHDEYLDICFHTANDLSKKYDWKVINCDSNKSIRPIEDIQSEIIEELNKIIDYE